MTPLVAAYTPTEILAALSNEVAMRRMSVSDALSRAFVCGLNTALHIQQDREAAESGEFLAAIAAR